MSWIDIAKGICLIAVVYGHSGSAHCGFVYSFHLTVFFILSGYTLSKKPLTVAYIAEKFRRLMAPFFYFLLAAGWAYMIHSGAMEIAMRNYGNVGITVLGVLCAFGVSYLLCSYLTRALPAVACRMLGWIGQSTVYILILHCVFSGYIGNFIQITLGMNGQNIFYLGTTVLIQVVLGVAVFLLWSSVKKLLKKRARQITAGKSV